MIHDITKYFTLTTNLSTIDSDLQYESDEQHVAKDLKSSEVICQTPCIAIGDDDDELLQFESPSEFPIAL